MRISAVPSLLLSFAGGGAVRRPRLATQCAAARLDSPMRRLLRQSAHLYRSSLSRLAPGPILAIQREFSADERRSECLSPADFWQPCGRSSASEVSPANTTASGISSVVIAKDFEIGKVPVASDGIPNGGIHGRRCWIYHSDRSVANAHATRLSVSQLATRFGQEIRVVVLCCRFLASLNALLSRRGVGGVVGARELWAIAILRDGLERLRLG
jgi:hypothetical protein